MAKCIKYTEEQEQEYRDWLEERPQCIKDLVAKYSLRRDTLYRLKTTSQRVVLYSMSENGTVTVSVLSIFNSDMIPGLFERNVFGINPADLEECDWEGELQVH